MSELQFCKQYLSALDSRPIKLSSDHIADPRSYPAQPAFVLPRLPHPPHPQRPKPNPTTATASNASASTSTSQLTISITLKPLKLTSPTVPLSSISPTTTSIYDLKQAYSTSTSLPLSKIKLLYKKKPVPDSKTVAEVIGPDAGDVGVVEFGVMVMGGATPVASPPAVAPPTEEEKGLGVGRGLAAQEPSGKSVVESEEFWGDLRGFVLQRIRDEKEADRLLGVFRGAWEKDRQLV
ncbi:uncharacterized protein BDR25DRAFT_301610 [Lindgomyces ingoldianus]|uniref:Uncharacterized protein n=1 Tax=Lindgomyces ingoldianus TaxID=673940 RepID=A0ACB6R4C7_9PLEO|nr:uncharacterized protein BDR25DRAFT_301610 [Lindgomyces ingoldianus]KAF2474138.1 hypothetical protein BDR25DRAFT_301610 [Lindgomyces ingoldianus]